MHAHTHKHKESTLHHFNSLLSPPIGFPPFNLLTSKLDPYPWNRLGLSFDRTAGSSTSYSIPLFSAYAMAASLVGNFNCLIMVSTLSAVEVHPMRGFAHFESTSSAILHAGAPPAVCKSSRLRSVVPNVHGTAEHCAQGDSRQLTNPGVEEETIPFPFIIPQHAPSNV